MGKAFEEGIGISGVVSTGKKADKAQLADLLISLGDLMVEESRIEEIEINPLFLTREGPVAADARIRLSPERDI